MELNKLDIWNEGMELAAEIYNVVKQLPKEETYSLSDQMRRAAVSIPSNVAEGYKRNSDREFLRFLSIANGSCAELETQLLLAKKVGLLNDDQIEKALQMCDIEQKKISSFIGHIQRKEK